MNSGETFDDDRPSAQVSRLERSVLARTSLAVVLLAHCHPLHALRLKRARNHSMNELFVNRELVNLVCARYIWYATELASQLIFHVVCFIILRIYRSDQVIRSYML